MRWAWLLLIPALAWGQMHEILRPTADVNSTVPISPCAGGNVTSTMMPNSWDAAGLSTSNNQSLGVTLKTPKFAVRIFTPWASTTNTYSALTLNINSASAGGAGSFGGDAYLFYSLNSGSTWTTVLSDNTGPGWAQQTSTIALSAGQALSALRVAVCVDAGGDGTNPGFDNVQVWDIWTDGSYIPPPTPTPIPPSAPAVQQPTVISKKSSMALWAIWWCGRLW